MRKTLRQWRNSDLDGIVCQGKKIHVLVCFLLLQKTITSFTISEVMKFKGVAVASDGGQNIRGSKKAGEHVRRREHEYSTHIDGNPQL